MQNMHQISQRLQNTARENLSEQARWALVLCIEKLDRPQILHRGGKRWDSMGEQGFVDEVPFEIKTLGLYLYDLLRNSVWIPRYLRHEARFIYLYF